MTVVVEARASRAPYHAGGAAIALLLLRRLAEVAITLLITSFLAFAFLQAAPGDPVQIILGGRAGDAAAVGRLRAEYYLDHSFLAQYLHWLSGAVTGEFGTSYIYGSGVDGLITSRLPTTALLVVYGSVFVVAFGFLVGLVAARARPVVDGALAVVISLALATPTYVVAIVLITIFSLHLDWFPVFGSGSGFFDRLHHLTLPAFTLALGASAAMARVTRASILEEGTRDHVTTAVARGLPRRDVLWRHVVRNAMLPITTSAGMIVAGMVAGTVIVEQAFGLDGIGSLLVLAINRKDYPVVLAVTLIIVAAFLIVNAVVDALYAAIDPRTRGAGTR